MVFLPWEDKRLTPGGPLIKTSLADEETAELQRLAAGRDVLEVGSAFGWSACAMALAGAASVTAVDPHQSHITNEYRDDTLAVMRASLEAHGVADAVDIVRVTSAEAFAEFSENDVTFDLVFIDGDHEEEAVRHDVTGALKVLEPGGVLACHDYGNIHCPGIAAALDDLFPDGPTRLVHSLWVLET